MRFSKCIREEFVFLNNTSRVTVTSKTIYLIQKQGFANAGSSRTGFRFGFSVQHYLQTVCWCTHSLPDIKCDCLFLLVKKTKVTFQLRKGYYFFSKYDSFLQVSRYALIFPSTFTPALNLYSPYFSKSKRFYYFCYSWKDLAFLSSLLFILFIQNCVSNEFIFITPNCVCVQALKRSNYSSTSSLKKVLIQTLQSSERWIFSLQNATHVNDWFCSFFSL